MSPMKPVRQPVITPVLKFLGTRTPTAHFERFLQWSLLGICLFYRGDGNHLEVSGLVSIVEAVRAWMT